MRAFAVTASIAAAAPAAAQGLPSEPISVANGRFVFSGEFFATIGSSDPGYFNYTDYEYHALRNVRFGIATEVRASSRVQFLAEVRVDHGDRVTPYALFVRVRPWPERRFDVQIGRVPPTFGAFTDTIYAYKNPLIGQPVAYQYLLSLQPTSVPSTPDDLVRMHGRGWLSAFPVGDPTPTAGVPIVNTARFDTGVQVHGVTNIFEWTGAVTTGSLSDPLVGDNNDRPQVAGRLITRPITGLALGLSVARGAWLDVAIDSALPDGESVGRLDQSALAADAEYSAGPFLVRGEVARARWTLPDLPTWTVDRPLGAWSTVVEGRYKILPGFTMAARGDRVRFDRLPEPANQAWEAAVDRIEVGTDVSVTRNILWKVSWQRNVRDGGRVRHISLVASQLVYWF
jgi:hypothetical protein